MKIFPSHAFSRVYIVSLTETTADDDANALVLFIGDGDVIDCAQLFEKMLSENDGSFPVVMDFLLANNLITSLSTLHSELGYSFINSQCNVADTLTKMKLVNNLSYLQLHSCDLDLEMFNFLRSLTFGGKIVKRGTNYLDVIKILLPYCTDFFNDVNYWKKIRYFCSDTKEIIAALDFLIANYGSEVMYKFLPPQAKYEPFTLCHLARNKARSNMFKRSGGGCDVRHTLAMMSMCRENLPKTLCKYLFFLDE